MVVSVRWKWALEKHMNVTLEIQHLCEQQVTAWNQGTTKWIVCRRLCVMYCENISSATLEKPTNVAVPRLNIIYVSFESHLSKFRSLIVVHMVYCGRVFLYGEVLGIICLFYQSHGGSSKPTVWLCSVWKLSRPMSAVQYKKYCVNVNKKQGSEWIMW